MRDSTEQRRNTQSALDVAQMRHAVAGTCRTALDAYREAGYPFGKTMDGMLIWYEYGQKTTDN